MIVCLDLLDFESWLPRDVSAALDGYPEIPGHGSPGPTLFEFSPPALPAYVSNYVHGTRRRAIAALAGVRQMQLVSP